MNESAATHACPAGQDSQDSARASLAHILAPGTLLAVFAALIVLTVATVAVTRVDLGPWNLVAALAIATLKASLVALYFMHLRYDHPFHGLMFVASLVFLAIFLLFTLMDAVAYQPDVERLREAEPAAVSARHGDRTFWLACDTMHRKAADGQVVDRFFHT